MTSLCIFLGNEKVKICFSSQKLLSISHLRKDEEALHLCLGESLKTRISGSYFTFK